MPDSPNDDSARIAELGAIIQAVRDRVRARYPEPETASNGDGSDSNHLIRVPIADLMPLVHARDAAQAKIAAIGSVNPRAGGAVNSAIQFFKKSIARSLQWFVRDQIAFNRETVSALEAVMEALNEHNRVAVSLAAQANEQIGTFRNETREELQKFAVEARELRDIRTHFPELRADWDRKVAANEVQFLRNVADLQAAFQHRSTLMETNLRELARSQHTDYLGALDRANIDIQKRLWQDMEKIRQEFDRLIHTELRLIRQRTPVAAAPTPVAAVSTVPAPASDFDYGRFAERFRGSEEYVRSNVEFYKTFFAGCTNVLDIGCGRGEFLTLIRDQGVAARGIDLSEESVAQCKQSGVNAEVADLFAYLAGQPEHEFDGIFSSQVVEHLDPKSLPEMVRLCASRLRRGGLLAIETPNPECLAIFATHFYLDPTHTRPIPHPLMAFYMEEAGLGQIEVHKLSPAVDSMPEIAELPESFRRKFFGGLDYAIIGRRL
ncbi:MAG TPA: methyltransferase domain-containing protein [Bryobacteraceae bacterium]|nr:methyltransferase domain-containing protein [Bryobacteraceae bacterium]